MDDHPLHGPDQPDLVHLGTFAPPLAGRIAALLRHRGIAHAADLPEPGEDPTDVDVDVAPDWRDDLAAELFTNWPELLRGLSPEEAAQVAPTRGSHPGWRDAPTDAWIDDLGRLQVETDGEEVRAIGPALAVGGLALTLLGIFADTIPTGFGVTFGLFAVVLGVLLPR